MHKSDMISGQGRAFNYWAHVREEVGSGALNSHVLCGMSQGTYISITIQCHSQLPHLLDDCYRLYLTECLGQLFRLAFAYFVSRLISD